NHGADDDETVLHRVPEEGLMDGVPEVRKRRVGRNPLWRVAEDLLSRLERRRDHPVDGEDHHGEHEQAEQVPAELACPPSPPSPSARRGSNGRRRDLRDRSHCTSPVLRILRRYRRVAPQRNSTIRTGIGGARACWLI